MKTHRVSKENKGERLDIYMMNVISDITRSRVQHLIKEKKILVDGNPTKPSYTLKGIESIDYAIDQELKRSENSQKIIFEPIDFNILF